MAICPLTYDGFKPSNLVACLPCCWNHKLGSRQIELIPGVILCHCNRRIRDIDECDMTHPLITSESHTQGEEQKGCVSSSLDRNYLDSSINYGLDVVFESVHQMTHALCTWLSINFSACRYGCMCYIFEYRPYVWLFAFRHLQVDTDVIDMIPCGSDDVKPPWTFQTYLGNLPPTATRMSAPCVSAWRPPWARSCWPQAPRASASWLWILFHVVSKSTLCLIQFVAVSRVNLSQANVLSLFDFATCIGLSNCFNWKCRVWHEWRLEAGVEVSD